ncbi:Protoheme IX farnesyltransferase [Raoultella terrigena]|uniref:heme o synthase n=1 Tax=Raoultella terrigena TaxID=577 RepID=A0A485B4B4_RAOTE|nr:Protoheme IX farnesyltransferase [Raoultella terrigena]
MGFVVYVGVYSLYMKRHSVYGTLIGSLSGAAPPVIGYCAVTGNFDSGAAILLAIFSLWQMPHSYAIAIFRFKDYQAANIPVLPVVKGISVAKNHITVYIIAFAVATLMLSLGGYAGYKYLVVAAAVSVWWLGMALRGYKVADDKVWARKLFVFSIVAHYRAVGDDVRRLYWCQTRTICWPTSDKIGSVTNPASAGFFICPAS